MTLRRLRRSEGAPVALGDHVVERLLGGKPATLSERLHGRCSKSGEVPRGCQRVLLNRLVGDVVEVRIFVVDVRANGLGCQCMVTLELLPSAGHPVRLAATHAREP